MVGFGLRTSGSLVVLGALLALVSPGAALAQSGPEADNNDVIIVTAQRREEAQVDVPISITTLGEAALTTSNVQQLADIAKITPGLRFDFASGFFQPTVRGVGTAVTTSGGGGNVGIYVDGFYSPNPLASDFDLLSVSSIQVLKGPQGTLFGRNTTGGAILVQTHEPSTEATTAQARLSYGRYNEINARGLLNYVISDRVALGVEGQFRKGDGWQRDISSGKKVGDYENWSLRIGMKAELAEGVDLLVRYKHGKVDDPSQLLPASWQDSRFGLGAPFGGIPGTYATGHNEIASGSVPEFLRSNSDVGQITLRADIGFADLSSYTQYRNERVNSSIELDYSGLDIFQLGLPNNNETWSQEFLLTSKPGTPLQWTAGLFYFENTDQYITYIDNFGSSAASRIRLGGSSTKTKSYAAFVDGTYEITPQVFVTAGVRYAKDKIGGAYFNTRFLSPTLVLNDGTVVAAPGGRVYLKDFDPGAVDFADRDKITPRFVIRYKPTDATSIYASYTKGYKAAIIDVGGSCQNPPYRCNRVKPESIDAFEAGVKYDAGGLSAEFAGFYYDYKDLQVSLYESGTATIVNAAKSEIYGAETQLRYRVNQAFQLSAGASYVHARYKNFNNAPIYTPCSTLDAATQAVCAANGLSFLVLGQNLHNVDMQRTPEFTGFIGARYTADLGGGELALSGNLSYTSSFFFGPSGTQFRQGGYETLSLRAEWTDPSDRFSIAAFGDNVTNDRHYTGAQYSNFGIGGNWNKPVTYGVELGVKY